MIFLTVCVDKRILCESDSLVTCISWQKLCSANPCRLVEELQSGCGEPNAPVSPEGLFVRVIGAMKVKQAFLIPEEFIGIRLAAVGYPGDAGHLNDIHKELQPSSMDWMPDSEVI